MGKEEQYKEGRFTGFAVTISLSGKRRDFCIRENNLT